MSLLKKKTVGGRYSAVVRVRSKWSFVALSALAFTQGALLVSNAVPAAYAQAVTDDDVINYARAIVDIETQRLGAYEEASNLLSSVDSELSILEIPLSCTSAGLSDMPDMPRADRVDLRTILVTFCNNAKEIADTNGLTPKRFNSITESHREDAELEARIIDAIQAL